MSRPRKSLVVVWRDAIRDSSLDSTARHVAHVLSTWMSGDGGVCWPKRETIAAGTGYSTRTIERAVQRLEQAGWLRVERGLGTSSNRYFALLPLVASESRHKEWAVATLTVRSGDSDDRSGDTGVARKRLKRESGAPSDAAPLSGSASSARYPEGECEVCGRVRGLVDSHARLCGECYEEITAEAIEERERAAAAREGAA